MIKNSVSELLESRGITPYKFFQETGIARGTAYRLANNPEAMPTGEVLDLICSAYQIQPGDLIHWVDDDVIQ